MPASTEPQSASPKAPRIAGAVDLYVHLPFCRARCDFCFYVAYAGCGANERRAYLEQLVREIAHRWRETDPEVQVGSLYFGGGTPSLLSADEWSWLLDQLQRYWAFASIPEVTVECNPRSLTKRKLALFQAVGVNRLSLGVQSLDDGLLAGFGREGASAHIERLVDVARSVGIENLNADVMVGLPGETEETVLTTLDGLADLGLPHLSVYPFALRPAAALFGRSDTPREAAGGQGTRLERLGRAAAHLQDRGYRRLGAAHFALDARYECRHHRHFWDGGEVAGFGVSAQSFLDGSYLKNTPDLTTYCGRDPNQLTEYAIPLGLSDQVRRWILLALTKRLGFALEDLAHRFGPSAPLLIEPELIRLREAGLVHMNDVSVRLAPRGIARVHLIPAFYLQFESAEYTRVALRRPVPSAKLAGAEERRWSGL